MVLGVSTQAVQEDERVRKMMAGPPEDSGCAGVELTTVIVPPLVPPSSRRRSRTARRVPTSRDEATVSGEIL